MLLGSLDILFHDPLSFLNILATFIATGGLASLFSKDSNLIDIVDLDLTIKGIALASNHSLNVFK